MIKIIIILTLFFTTQSFAIAENEFNSGIQLFKNRDFTGALANFKLAEEKGLNSTELFYNLGSTYYKLARYDEAKHYFEKFGRARDMRDLADFNLGLIAIIQKDIFSARNYFNSVLKITKDQKLKTLSKQQLIKLQKPEKAWKLYLSANFGYDDNITSASDEQAADISDAFYDMSLSLDGLITGSRKEGWVANANYFSLDFFDSNDFDENQMIIGIKKAHLLSDWETSVHLSLAKNDYADDDYQSSTRIDIKGRKVLSKESRFYLRYRIDDISSEDSKYDYLEGWRQRLRTEYRQYGKSAIKQLYYELELNDRNDLVTTDYSYEYSPTRHTLRGKYTHILDDEWQLTGDLSYRLSDYPKSSSFNRDDERFQLTLIADYRFDKTFKVSTRIQFTQNDSSVDQYDYDRSLIKVGISKLF